MIIVFNGLGLAFGACALLVGFGVRSVFHTTSDWLASIAAGIVLAGLDLAYRATKGDREWAERNRGGSFFWLPAWVFGAFFIIAGIVSLFRGT